MALDRASISDGLWTVPSLGGDTPLTIVCWLGALSHVRGGPVTYASSVTWFGVDCVALLKGNGGDDGFEGAVAVAGDFDVDGANGVSRSPSSFGFGSCFY